MWGWFFGSCVKRSTIIIIPVCVRFSPRHAESVWISCEGFKLKQQQTRACTYNCSNTCRGICDLSSVCLLPKLLYRKVLSLWYEAPALGVNAGVHTSVSLGRARVSNASCENLIIYLAERFLFRISCSDEPRLLQCKRQAA